MFESILWRIVAALLIVFGLCAGGGVSRTEAAVTPRPYIGIGGLSWEYELEDLEDNFAATGGLVKLGYQLKYLAYELRAGGGGVDQLDFPPIGEVEIKLEHVASLLLKPGIPLGRGPRPPGWIYGIVGISNLKQSYTTAQGTLSESESGLTYGLGISLGVGNFRLFGEWIRYLEETDDNLTTDVDYEFSGYSFGISYLFN